MGNKKKKSAFKKLGSAGVGLAGATIGIGVGAAAAGGIAAGTPAMGAMGGFSTLASFAPVASTAVGGKIVLDELKTLKGKKKKGKQIDIDNLY